MVQSIAKVPIFGQETQALPPQSDANFSGLLLDIYKSQHPETKYQAVIAQLEQRLLEIDDLSLAYETLTPREKSGLPKDFRASLLASKEKNVYDALSMLGRGLEKRFQYQNAAQVYVWRDQNRFKLGLSPENQLRATKQADEFRSENLKHPTSLKRTINGVLSEVFNPWTLGKLLVANLAFRGFHHFFGQEMPKLYAYVPAQYYSSQFVSWGIKNSPLLLATGAEIMTFNLGDYLEDQIKGKVRTSKEYQSLFAMNALNIGLLRYVPLLGLSNLKHKLGKEVLSNLDQGLSLTMTHTILFPTLVGISYCASALGMSPTKSFDGHVFDTMILMSQFLVLDLTIGRLIRMAKSKEGKDLLNNKQTIKLEKSPAKNREARMQESSPFFKFVEQHAPAQRSILQEAWQKLPDNVKRDFSNMTLNDPVFLKDLLKAWPGSKTHSEAVKKMSDHDVSEFQYYSDTMKGVFKTNHASLTPQEVKLWDQRFPDCPQALGNLVIDTPLQSQTKIFLMQSFLLH